jgi:hypothetical protein
MPRRIIYHLDNHQYELPDEKITQELTPHIGKRGGYPELQTTRLYFFVDRNPESYTEMLVKIICGGINNPSDEGIIVFKVLMARNGPGGEWIQPDQLMTIEADQIEEVERDTGLHFYRAFDITPQIAGGKRHRKTKRSRRRTQTRKLRRV